MSLLLSLARYDIPDLRYPTPEGKHDDLVPSYNVGGNLMPSAKRGSRRRMVGVALSAEDIKPVVEFSYKFLLLVQLNEYVSGRGEAPTLPDPVANKFLCTAEGKKAAERSGSIYSEAFDLLCEFYASMFESPPSKRDLNEVIDAADRVLNGLIRRLNCMAVQPKAD